MRSAAPGVVTPLAARAAMPSGAHVLGPAMHSDREAARPLADRAGSPAPLDRSVHAGAVHLARVDLARRSVHAEAVPLVDRADLAGRRPEDSAAAPPEAVPLAALDRAAEPTSEEAAAVTLAAAATEAVIAKR